MAEIIKETITTEGKDSDVVIQAPAQEATNSQTVEYVAYFMFGVLEVLLAFRLLLKLFGASSSSFFVRFIYSTSGIFVLPFEGIFRKLFAQGAEVTSVLEPATLVALLVYAVLAWGVIKLIRISSGEKQVE